MKTINFLHYVKYPVLLFVAFFGILIGGQQTAPRQFTNIGGNGAGSPAPRSFVSNDHPEIGGGQTAPRPVQQITDEIGGSQTAPRGFYESLDPIGGNSAPRSYAYRCMEIGGGGNETRKIFADVMLGSAGNEGLDFDKHSTNQLPYLSMSNFAVQYSVDDFSDAGLDFAIGGQTTPGSEARQFVSAEIGGGQTAPRQLEIGGQTVPSTRPLMLAVVEGTGNNYVAGATSLANGFPDIGGAQGAPRTS